MVDWAIELMNDGDVVADFDSDLVGEGAHSEVKAVAISAGRQTQGIDTASPTKHRIPLAISCNTASLENAAS